MSPDALPWILDRLQTPIGTLLVVTDGAHCLRAIDWQDHIERLHRLFRHQYRQPVRLVAGRAPAATSEALAAYFAGHVKTIDSLAVATGGTTFQRRVWSALRAIPAGQTISYQALAASIGHPRAVRAVGTANGANPIGIVVPCHRVLGSDGSLTGYGGGLDRKRWLLSHEGAAATPSQGSRATALQVPPL
jgi:methylated-DNA-[protein]-cysteine S-methyltransferase